jgi:hypothetical protein
MPGIAENSTEPFDYCPRFPRETQNGYALKMLQKPTLYSPVNLSQDTLDWFQSITYGHKRLHQDEGYRKSIASRMSPAPLGRPHVHFDVEPTSEPSKP